jgi:hypothetical protein
MLFSNIIERICKMSKKPLEYPRDNSNWFGCQWEGNVQNSHGPRFASCIQRSLQHPSSETTYM